MPYLRDRDIMKAVAGQEYSDRIEAMRNGMKEHYSMMAQKMKNYSDVPCIATGHLFAQNTILSDNAARQEGENDIHIGNLVQIDMSAFYQQFSYLALGHIHKPEELSSRPPIWYTGSPQALSSKEEGIHGPLLITVSPNSSNIDIEQVSLSTTRYMDIDIDITGIENGEDFRAKVINDLNNYEIGRAHV